MKHCSSTQNIRFVELAKVALNHQESPRHAKRLLSDDKWKSHHAQKQRQKERINERLLGLTYLAG